MANLGAITDGISRDLGHALGVMTEVGLTHAELQFIGEKEVGDLTDQERKEAKSLIDDHGLSVSCVSRHNFVGAAVRDVEVGDAVHTKHMDGLKRCIEMAHEFGSPLVRIMSFNKDMILFGSHGADHWQVAKGAKGKETVTQVARLDVAERREELARMLAGEQVTDEARSAADSLLQGGQA